jgi:AmmeMemoRadiSam system protein B
MSGRASSGTSADASPGTLSAPRPPAVAGLFYPADAGSLRALVDELAAGAASAFPPPAGPDPVRLVGILVPHAGLVYSGLVAAAAWRLWVGADGEVPSTIVLLGTNHGAPWLDGIGAWDRGPWRTPLGEVAVDRALSEAILALGPPFEPDAACHLGEHSLEVQLPFVTRLAPGSRIVALSVGAGTGGRAIAAGEGLGRLLAERRAAGDRILVAISTDMAHYPAASIAEAVTEALRPSIVGLDAAALAVAEAELVRRRPGVSCGMCGIEPAVVGLAALRAMGARRGTVLATATSADAGGDPRRTVGYLAVGFEAA